VILHVRQFKRLFLHRRNALHSCREAVILAVTQNNERRASIRISIEANHQLQHRPIAVRPSTMGFISALPAYHKLEKSAGG
jgi:hypothetical protein